MSILVVFDAVSTHSAYAVEGVGEGSAAREAIERTEEKVLGSAKHAELEKVEPGIDTSIKQTLPVALGGIGVLSLVVALYLKSKRKKA